MPFHTNPNNKSQRTRWLENFYPKFGNQTRGLIEKGFGQKQAFPPITIYFPDNVAKSKEEQLQDLISKAGGAGPGEVPPVGPPPTPSSTDSAEHSTSITPVTTTTGGGGTTGSGGSGTGISTPGDYDTSGSHAGSITDEGSTTGGGGTTMTGGGVVTGFTTGYSGTISYIPPEPSVGPPPDTGGSGTSYSGYDATCDGCKVDLPAFPYSAVCGHGWQTQDEDGNDITALWTWSNCFRPEIVYNNWSLDWGPPQVCDPGTTECPLVIVAVEYTRTLCGCAIAYGCAGGAGSATNCSPTDPYSYCLTSFNCCYKEEATLDGALTCWIKGQTTGMLYNQGSGWPCSYCTVTP